MWRSYLLRYREGEKREAEAKEKMEKVQRSKEEEGWRRWEEQRRKGKDGEN